MVGIYEVPEALDSKEPANTTLLLARKLAEQSSHPAIVLHVRWLKLTQADGKQLLAPELKALTTYVENADGKAPKSSSKPVTNVSGYKELVSVLDVEVNDGLWKRLADWDDHLEDTRLDWLNNPNVAP